MRFLYSILWIAVVGCQSTALTSAKIYLQEDQIEQAREQLEKALVATPDDPEVHYLLGKVQGMEADFTAMAASFGRSLELGPKFSDEIAQLRRYYWAQEYNRGVKLATGEQPDYDAARQAFATATVVDPEGIQAWRNLAYTHYQLEDLAAAITTYKRIVELAPADTATLSNLGALCIQQKRYQEAVEPLSRLVEIHPKDTKAHVNLGIAYEKLGRLEEAEAAYRTAVELAPDEPLAHYGLGNYYWNRDQYPAAREAYARTVELDPDDADARFNLAMTYLRLEDDESALPLLEQLSEEMPDSGTVWRQLSLIYARQDRVAESKAADARAREQGY